jgi:hypothetical protein
MCPPCRLVLGFLFGILLGLLPALVQAQPAASGDAWCTAQESHDGDRAHAYAVHTYDLDARREVTVDAGQNGGVAVEAWDGAGIALCAVVRAEADTEAAARRLAEGVEVARGATIRADVPRTRRGESVSVSFRLRVPRTTDLDLTAANGGIAVEGVRGRVRFETTNGGVSLVGAGGDVRGRTVNGGVNVMLTGARWDGAGLDVETVNGGVNLVVPEGYSAALETGTVNGGLSLGFPLTVQGEVGRRLAVTLGGGGPRVRAVTTNGGVRLARG